MHIKDLKRLQAQVKRLEELDKEIIKIDQYAQNIKDKSLSLRLELSHRKPDQSKVEFDEDGSIVNTPASGLSLLHRMYMPSLIEFGTGSKSEGKKDSCRLDISEVIGLEVLGVIVAHKHGERMVIIKQLQDAGFEVSI
jgi:hypothetical protein